jgi:hypothetical protein
MTLSLLARRVSRVSRSNPVIKRAVETARERAVTSSLIRSSSRMRTKMTTAMASNRSRKRGNVEVTAEAVVVELAVAAVDIVGEATAPRISEVDPLPGIMTWEDEMDLPAAAAWIGAAIAAR